VARARSCRQALFRRISRNTVTLTIITPPKTPAINPPITPPGNLNIGTEEAVGVDVDAGLASSSSVDQLTQHVVALGFASLSVSKVWFNLVASSVLIEFGTLDQHKFEYTAVCWSVFLDSATRPHMPTYQRWMGKSLAFLHNSTSRQY
jgi:hypothetical protein